MAVTKAQIIAAAEAVQAEKACTADKVTIADVRIALGDTGSRSTINPHLAAWKADQKAPADPAPEVLTASVVNFFNEYWHKAKAAASSEFETERQKYREEIASLDDELQSQTDRTDEVIKTVKSVNQQMSELQAVHAQEIESNLSLIETTRDELEKSRSDRQMLEKENTELRIMLSQKEVEMDVTRGILSRLEIKVVDMSVDSEVGKT